MSERRSKRVSDVKTYDESMDVADFEDEDVALEDKKPVISSKAAQSKRKATDDSDDGEYGKPKKQSKTAAKKKRRASEQIVRGEAPGRLSMLLDMPVDILTMIYGRLAPIDLLRLARVNKQLRAWLHSEDANVVWVMARKGLVFWQPPDDVAEKNLENPGDIADLYNATRNWEPCFLPDPPEGTTEFDYAFLIFGDKECIVCGATKRVTFVDYGLGLKLCRPCKKEHMLKTSKAKEYLRNTFGKKHDKGSLDVTPAHIGNGKQYFDDDLLEWHKLYCRKKRADDETFEEWIEERKETIRDAHELGKTIEKWLPSYRRWSGQLERQFHDAVWEQRRRRAKRLKELAQNESWWDASLWNNFYCGSLGDEMHYQSGEVTLEYWTEFEPKVRAEMDQRRAYALTFEDWDSKDGTRDWIYAQYASDFLAGTTNAIHGLAKGDVLALPSIAPFLLKTSTNYPSEVGVPLPDDERLPQMTPAAAWRALWVSKHAILRQEAEDKQLEILGGLCQMVRNAFPDLQPSHQHILEDAALSGSAKIAILVENLQAPWCLLTCTVCQENDDSYRWHSPQDEPLCLTVADALKHEHFTTRFQNRDFNERDGAEEPYYGKQIFTAWRVPRVALPPRLSQAAKILLCACEARIEAGLASDTKEDDMTRLPSSIQGFDEDWRFQCNETSECDQYNYCQSIAGHQWPITDWRGRKGSWRCTIEHVRKHLKKADPRGLGKIACLASLKVVPKPGGKLHADPFMFDEDVKPDISHTDSEDSEDSE